jgi:hypothetical protein
MVILFSALWLASSTRAQEFSADVVSRDPTGRVSSGKLYRGANKIRFESAMPAQGNPDAGGRVIVDLAQKVSYGVLPGRQMIMVIRGKRSFEQVKKFFPASDDPCRPLDEPAPPDASCKKLGDETVNGRRTVKWEGTQMINRQPLTARLWLDPQLHTYIKVQMTAGGAGSFELQNIRVGPQPASLFELPAGYQRMDLGGR